MIKKKMAGALGLGAMMLFLSSSKEENKETIYADELNALAQETLIGGGQMEADSLKSKMMILSFWAAYDPASRINTTDLLNICDKYADAKFDKGTGLNVVCVSLDVFRSPVTKAIEADGTQNFYHICDYKGIESPLAKDFDVNRPVNLLISADGQILARDFGTKTIESTLQLMAN